MFRWCCRRRGSVLCAALFLVCAAGTWLAVQQVLEWEHSRHELEVRKGVVQTFVRERFLYNREDCTFHKTPLVFVGAERDLTVTYETGCPVTLVPQEIRLWTSEKVVSPANIAIRSDQDLTIHEGRFRFASRQVSEHRWAYSFHFRALPPNTYYFSVTNGLETSDVYHFREPNSETDVVKVALIGNSRRGDLLFRHHLGHLCAQKPDFLVHLGNAVVNGADVAEWGMYLQSPLDAAMRRRRVPLVSLSGTYDVPEAGGLDGGLRQAFTAGSDQGRTYFAKTIRGTHMIFLDSTLVGDQLREQEAWLERELLSVSSLTASFRAIFMHATPFLEYESGLFARAQADGDSVDVDPALERRAAAFGELVRTKWVPIFESSKVDLLVSAQGSLYQRGLARGVVHAVVGGGGAPLAVPEDRAKGFHMYEVTEFRHHYVVLQISACVIEWEVRDIDDQVMEVFELESKMFACEKEVKNRHEIGVERLRMEKAGQKLKLAAAYKNS